MFKIGQKVKFHSRINFLPIYGVIESSINEKAYWVLAEERSRSILHYVEVNRIDAA